MGREELDGVSPKVVFVSIQLVSPASGEEKREMISLSSFITVSIQLVSPASGED